MYSVDIKTFYGVDCKKRPAVGGSMRENSKERGILGDWDNQMEMS